MESAAGLAPKSLIGLQLHGMKLLQQMADSLLTASRPTVSIGTLRRARCGADEPVTSSLGVGGEDNSAENDDLDLDAIRSVDDDADELSSAELINAQRTAPADGDSSRARLSGAEELVEFWRPFVSGLLPRFLDSRVQLNCAVRAQICSCVGLIPSAVWIALVEPVCECSFYSLVRIINYALIFNARIFC